MEISIIISIAAFLFAWNADRKYSRFEKRIKRINDVMDFQLKVIDIDIELYKRLPEFEVMVNDGKELDLKNYINDYEFSVN